MFRSKTTLPLFKCLNEFAMLATKTLQENSVILVNLLDTLLFKSQLLLLLLLMHFIYRGNIMLERYMLKLISKSS